MARPKRRSFAQPQHNQPRRSRRPLRLKIAAAFRRPLRGDRSRALGSRRRGYPHLEPLEPRMLLSAQPLISEFMASNDLTIADGDGKFSDWIEVSNPTAAPIDFDGWHLTDDADNLDKWTFPAVTLAPGEFLVVFASGQAVEDYVDPAGYLHTDFKLSSEGEYLALTDPYNTVIHEYALSFPNKLPTSRTEWPKTWCWCRSSMRRARQRRWCRPMEASARHGPRSDSTIRDGSQVVAASVSASMRATTTRPKTPTARCCRVGCSVLISPIQRKTASSTGRSRRAAVRREGRNRPKALDNTTDTKWLAFEPTGTFYQFQFSGGQQHAVNAYTITSANDARNVTRTHGR